MLFSTTRSRVAAILNRLGVTNSVSGLIAARVRGMPATDQAALSSFISHGMLSRLGWYDSCASGRPVDSAGEPLPWLNYPAIHLLNERLPKNPSVIEFGAGMSTLWWAKRAGRVLTFENNTQWCSEIAGRAPAHVELKNVPLPELGTTLDMLAATGETFDLALIDNFDRATVAVKVMPFLHARSVVVFDNSDELVYRPCVDHIKAQGFRELCLHALGPVNPFEWSTSFLYRDNNCLGL